MMLVHARDGTRHAQVPRLRSPYGASTRRRGLRLTLGGGSGSRAVGPGLRQ